jgi:hypothetical protein
MLTTAILYYVMKWQNSFRVSVLVRVRDNRQECLWENGEELRRLCYGSPIVTEMLKDDGDGF